MPSMLREREERNERCHSQAETRDACQHPERSQTAQAKERVQRPLARVPLSLQYENRKAAGE
jgi:hypothetical protein